MSKQLTGPLSKEAVRKLAEYWQRCRMEDVAALFSAYDAKEAQTERVVSFRLGEKSIKRLFEKATSNGNNRYVVHLGLSKDYYSERVPKDSPFVLLIQAYSSPEDYQQECELLSWDANSRFTDSTGTESGVNAIPAASAYLFVHAWLETPLENLADVFQSVTHQQDRRVQAYVFSQEESDSITADLASSLRGSKNGEGKAELCIHLGKGLAVAGHPFSFRPVLEVKNAVNVKKPGKTARNATGLTDDDGNSYYDFSRPIPPPIPDEG